jgi:hypothetical protein
VIGPAADLLYHTIGSLLGWSGAVDHNPLGPAMPLHGLAQEALGCSEIGPLAEPELNGVAVVIDGAVKVHSPPADTVWAVKSDRHSETGKRSRS